MPLIHESYDSLPYVDPSPDAAALAAAKSVIDIDIQSAGIDVSHLHPSLIAAAKCIPHFSSAIEQEHARLQADPTSKLTAIDLKRYEEIEAPPNTTPTSDEDRPELLQQWTQALKKAYTSSEYIQGRLTELGLLEKFGKNSWLVGNSQLEDILKAIETDLVDVRKQQEDTESIRRAQQDEVYGEIKALEETWTKVIGRVLEAEVAAEGLKHQILEKRRAGAV